MPGESIIKYWTDFELLCAWLDSNIPEQKLCGYILKAHNPVLSYNK